jgi:mRNA interferase MazF
MKDLHPFLVLSPASFNSETSLVIGLPMTTAQYNEDNPFAVPVGTAKGHKTGRTSYGLRRQPQSFDWRERLARPHAMGQLQDKMFDEVRTVLNQLIQLV